MQLKIYAAEYLQGKRVNWGYDRRWLNDYLSIVTHNYLAAFENYTYSIETFLTYRYFNSNH